MPRSAFGPYGWPSTATNSRFGIARVDDDLRDLLAVAQAEVRPRLAGVGGLVDAVAGREVGALQPFAAADVDDVRVRRRDRDRADRAGRLVVEDRRPGAAVVGRLPHAAVDGADVEHVRLRSERPPPPSCGRRGTGRSCATASPNTCAGRPAAPAMRRRQAVRRLREEMSGETSAREPRCVEVVTKLRLLTDCRTHRRGAARRRARNVHMSSEKTSSRNTYDHASPRSASGARTVSAPGARTGEPRRDTRHDHRAAAEPTVARHSC